MKPSEASSLGQFFLIPLNPLVLTNIVSHHLFLKYYLQIISCGHIGLLLSEHMYWPNHKEKACFPESVSWIHQPIEWVLTQTAVMEQMLLNESPVKTSSLRQPPLSSGDFLRALQPRSPFLIICRRQTSGHLRGSRWSSSVTVNLFLLVTGWTRIWWSLNSAHLRGVNQCDAVCLYWQSGAADLGWQKLLWATAEELDLLLCQFSVATI